MSAMGGVRQMGRARKSRAVVEATPAETVETLNGGLSHGPSKFRDEAEPIEDLMPGFATFVGDPPAELAHAVVQAPPTPAARRPAPRRVSAEVVKAETALINLDRRRQDSLAHAETVWAAKRVALIQSFPADVLAALEAMSVLEGEELEGIGRE